MDVIINQPEKELLYPFKDRVCEEITELHMLRDADQVIIKEKSHSLGSKSVCKIVVKYITLVVWILADKAVVYNSINYVFVSIRG